MNDLESRSMIVWEAVRQIIRGEGPRTRTPIRSLIDHWNPGISVKRIGQSQNSLGRVVSEGKTQQAGAR